MSDRDLLLFLAFVSTIVIVVTFTAFVIFVKWSRKDRRSKEKFVEIDQFRIGHDDLRDR